MEKLDPYCIPDVKQDIIGTEASFWNAVSEILWSDILAENS